uniref:Uncharacterized protein n=1 Tax=Rhodnius prolixus TaxID=13249 RepID=T1I5Y9_RHOPR
MFSWSEKFIKKISFVVFTGLLIFDICVSITPETLNYSHLHVVPLDNPTPHSTSINTAKTCTKTLADGTKTKIDCSLLESPKKEDNSLKKVVSTNIPLNSTKEHINVSSTTENSEVASMTDKTHLYTGGLDVDEIKTNNYSNVNKNLSSQSSFHQSNSTSVDHSKIHKSVVDQKGVKAENITAPSDASNVQKNDSNSRKLRSTKAAGIAAGICVALGAVAYVSLMLWKKISK